MNHWLTTIAVASLALSGCEPGPTRPEPERIPEERAAALFLEHCAICHGEIGDGRGPRRASLYRKPPDFRDPLWRASLTPDQLRASIRNGLPGSDMPSWKLLGESAIAGLADHVQKLGQ